MKSLKLFGILFSTCFFLSSRLIAQSISGVVADEDKAVLPLATINLSSNDSSLVRVVLADKNGFYEFRDLASGDYILKFSYIGYDSFQMRVSLSETPLKADTVILKISKNMLKGVVVSAEKPLITQEVDKIVLNVEGTILSKGNTALDLLKRSPGVSIDIANKVMLNGKQGVNIIIDDKPTNLSPSDLATLLSGMSSENIQSIELITNPSSKYNAAGNGGIINIVTKKAKKDGYNFSATLNTSRASHFRENFSSSFMKKVNKISYYNNLSLGNYPAEINMKSTRYIPHDTLTYHANTRSNSNYQSFFYKGGIDFQVSSETTLGALIVVNSNKGTSNFNTITVIDSITSNDTYNFLTQTHNNSRNKGLGFNFYSDSKLDTVGQKLTFNLDYSKYNSSSSGNISNTGDITDVHHLIRTSSANDINISSFKIDYVLPLTKTSKLESGMKGSWVSTGNQISFENNINGIYQNDLTKSNIFNVRENINAIYSSITHTFSTSFTAKAGFRIEQTNNRTHSIQSNRIDHNKYISLFPTFFINKKLNDRNSLNFSYGRRINRPSYQDLNPFIYYNNPYSYYQGNPFLKPDFSNSFTLGYSYRQKYFLSFNYMRSKGIIVATPSLDTQKNIELLTPVNLGIQNLYYLNFSSPIKVVKWWSIYNYLNLYYNNIQSDYLDDKFQVTKPTVYLYQNHSFALNKLSFEVQFNFDAAQYSGLYLIKSRFVSNLTVKKSFWKNNAATITLSANDIFRKAATNTSYNYQNLIGNSFGYYDNQYVQLSLNFNINKLTSRVNDNRERGNAEEQRRIKR